jgi:phosphoserine phosphatase
MSSILLIRPGCTDFDEQHRIQGKLDLPLCERGESQVEAAIQQLRGVPLDLLYTSPSEPARTTAERIGAALDIPVKTLEGLQNMNQGLWEGLQEEEIRRKHPKVYKQWQESPESICPPSGESLSEAETRVRKALERPLKKKGNIAIVASEPLAAIVAAVVKGVRIESVPPLCGGRCGTWDVLKENTYKSTIGEFVSPQLTATPPA